MAGLSSRFGTLIEKELFGGGSLSIGTISRPAILLKLGLRLKLLAQDKMEAAPCSVRLGHDVSATTQQNAERVDRDVEGFIAEGVIASIKRTIAVDDVAPHRVNARQLGTQLAPTFRLGFEEQRERRGHPQRWLAW